MKQAALYIALLMSCLCFTVTLSQAASITFGTTNDVSGGLRILDGQLCYPDGTCQSTAITADGSAIWGQISGILSNQTDLQNSLNLKEDKSKKNQVNGYAGLDASGKINPDQIFPLRVTSYADLPIPIIVQGSSPSWQTQGATWVEMPEFAYQFAIWDAQTYVEALYTDSIGTNGSYWCNVGIFIDNAQTPSCYGSWLGSPYGMSFSQQTLICKLGKFSVGNHQVRIKHRSQYCAYGNYWTDEYSTMRKLSLKVVY